MRYIVTILLAIILMSEGKAQRTDYRDHFLIGTSVGFTAAWTQVTLNGPAITTKDKNKAFINGVLWSSIIGIGKELIIDYPQGRGYVEWQDAACTIAGGVVGAGAMRLFMIEKKKPVMFAKGNYKGIEVRFR